jgi:hypothetical protein
MTTVLLVIGSAVGFGALRAWGKRHASAMRRRAR